MRSFKVRSGSLLVLVVSVGANAAGCGTDDWDGSAEAAQPAGQWVDGQDPAPATGGGNRCTDPLQPGQERSCRIGTRNYSVRAGTTMNRAAPVPVVIDIASTLGTPAQMLGGERFCVASLCWTGIGSGWAAESDTAAGGFVVIAPDRSALLPENADFLRQLVAEVGSTVDVDLNKVYVSGISDGANVALEAGCEGSATFAGISPNSGAGDCARAARPIPVIAFASRQDVNYTASYNAVQSAARANGCRGEPTPWRTFDANTRDAVCRSANGDPRARLVPCTDVRERVESTECRAWRECEKGAQVVICDVAAANPHGVLNVSGDAHLVYENASFLNTPSVAWRFFQQF